MYVYPSPAAALPYNRVERSNEIFVFPFTKRAFSAGMDSVFTHIRTRESHTHTQYIN